MSEVQAAGVALWRENGQGRQFAIVHRPHRSDWSLPKGKLDRGETHAVAAVRETREETGYSCALGAGLGEIRYPLPDNGSTKSVHYYTARVTGGEFTANDEVDELRWCDLAQARELLSYPHDAGVLERAAALGTGSATVLLVRHAKAGSRADWGGPDTERPLADAGLRQAEALRGLLALWSPERVYSAPRLRCVDTIAPLARDLGADIGAEPLLSEEGYWPDRAAGTRRLLEIAGTAAVTAICSQGGVIPDVVERLMDAAGTPVTGQVRSKKGSVWVLTLRRSENGLSLEAADYYPSALPKPA